MIFRKMIEEGQVKGNLKTIAPDTCLIASGNPNLALYYLVKGSASVIPSGGEPCVVQAGALIGLPDLMHKTYSQTVIAIEQLEVLCISKEELQQMLQVNAPLRLYLIQQLSKQTMLTSASYE
ncbi:cyclic nucleotide-binding domain-containing protein [Pontibacter sp. KCTC 32443]|uniref:cyclic nucleotide-binding domain-containing protein n=1 Tax=Pontibacter TaxID=323449 RepID=UPI00164E3DBC|nr:MULTISPECIES: cyclic nucleotide-binding domain-containing protein [Pontibacter]MBC5773519.1 cyclic nucleotide-binding domain-containing protein [Pontibacter sp. KCTC 32443]